jgi:hypothetical protein|tara:strand:+ start:778 stop:1068 length:291 start_codon:yes stop_codon:yes gene_type:complete
MIDMKKVIAAAALVLAGQPALAQESDSATRLLAAIEDAGCIINDENGEAIRLAASLTDDEAAEAVLLLRTDGRAVPHEDGVNVTNDALRVIYGECE